MGEGPLFHKPKSFLAARQILYASIFLGVLQFLLGIVSVGILNSGGIPAVLIIIVSYLIVIWLIQEMSACKKWARTALLVVILFVMLAYPLALLLQTKITLLQSSLLVILSALQIYALVLLYNKKCTAWFNSITHTEALP